MIKLSISSIVTLSHRKVKFLSLSLITFHLRSSDISKHDMLSHAMWISSILKSQIGKKEYDIYQNSKT